MGVIANQLGQPQGAVELIGKAIKLRPSSAHYHANLGLALQASGRLDDAIASYRQALSIGKESANTLNNLGNALAAKGQLEEAEDHYRRALRLEPGNAQTHNNLGNVLMKWERTDEAAGQFREALRLQPSYVEAHFNLGNLFYQLGEVDQALIHYREAVTLNPNHDGTHSNLGALFEAIDQYDHAEKHLREAVRLKPASADAHNNLAAVLRVLGKTEESFRHYDTALSNDPGNANAHHNKALALLATGRLEEGWREYEWRFKRKESRGLPSLPCPVWEGSPFEQQTLLVCAEQGVGDEIMSASCYTDLIPRVRRCLIQCDPRLESLLTRSFPQATFRGAPRDDFSWFHQDPSPDAFIMAGSLPRYLRSDQASFPDHHGYLVPDPERQKLWRQRVNDLGDGIKVGISWRSKQLSLAMVKHHTLLSQWKPILKVPGIRFVNLQYDDCRKELESVRKATGVTIHTWDDLDLFNDFEAVAALTSVLDLVITAPTSVADMAGALGVEVWMFYHSPDYKNLGEKDFPWYPRTKVLYRGVGGTWDAVLKTAAEQLKTFKPE